VAETPESNVHSIHVSHTVAPDDTGNLAPVKKLTYHVGRHGPFTHTYHADTGTTDKMKSDIGAQVAEIQALHQMQG
jgi:hypothetical protein